jgi:CRISPR-associated RAMP protein (TIGR02581 family)
MLKALVNELLITLQVSPHDAPLLIKSGRESGADPTTLDMSFVRTTHPMTGERTVYLPGSSLKGTIRADCERLARAAKPRGDSRWCCDPFDTRSSCGKRLEEEWKRNTKLKNNVALWHARSCVACRTFGSPHLASRFAIGDAYPINGVVIEQRDGVAIDRISGAVAAGPFNYEVVTGGAFQTNLSLRNFQLWQVGLVAMALRDLSEGRLPLGSGRSKGFGGVSATYIDATVAYPGQTSVRRGHLDFGKHMYDLTAFQFIGKEDYDLWQPRGEGVRLPAGAGIVEEGEYGRIVVKITGHESINALLLPTVGAWAYAVSSWKESKL